MPAPPLPIPERLRCCEQPTSVAAIEEVLRQSDLFRSTLYTHYPVAELVCVCEFFAIPGEMLACHPNPCFLPVKPVQFDQVAEHDITQFVIFYWRFSCVAA